MIEFNSLDTVAGALIALLTFGVGHYFGRHREVRSFKRIEYGLFLSSISGLARTHAASPEREKYDRQNVEAKSKIMLYGGSRVIDALEEYSRMSLDDQHGLNNAYCDLIEAMRADVGSERIPDLREKARKIMIEAHGAKLP